MTQIRAHQKRDIIAMFVMFAMVHATNALYITYIPLYLEDLAFGAAVRGVLLSIGPFVSMLTQTMWGGLADRSKNKSYVMFALAIGLTLVTTLFLASDFSGIDKILPAVLRPHRALIFVTLALILYAFFQNPMLPVIDTISMEYISQQRPKVKYGVIRTMGTASYVVMAYVGGIVVDASPIGTKTIFYMFYAVLAVLVLSLFFVPPVAGTQNKRQKVSALALFRDKWFCVMIIIAFVVGMAYGFNSSYYPNYMRNQLGASETVLGINTAIGSMLEIFLFIIVHKITKKTGIVNLILICILSGVIRWMMPVLTTSIPLLITVQFFTQPFNWALMIYAVAIYVQKAVPEHLHARGQTMINMVMGSVGRIAGSLIGGWLIGMWGEGSEPRVYLIMTIACALVFVFAVVMFRRFGWRLNREPDELRLEEDSVI